MGLKVDLHRRAVRDLEDIHDFRVREHGANAADRVRAELRDTFKRLALRPFRIGRPTADPEIRILSVRRYPYRIYYTVTAVAHIRHSARLDPDLRELGH
jgi:plasmid stabilization system protein ParE